MSTVWLLLTPSPLFSPLSSSLPLDVSSYALVWNVRRQDLFCVSRDKKSLSFKDHPPSCAPPPTPTRKRLPQPLPPAKSDVRRMRGRYAL